MRNRCLRDREEYAGEEKTGRLIKPVMYAPRGAYIAGFPKVVCRCCLAYLRKKGVAHAVLMSVDNAELNREICAQASDLHWMCNVSEYTPETVFDRLAEYKEAGALGVGELCVNQRMDSPCLQALFGAAESLEMPVLFHMSPEVGFQYGIVDEPGLPLLEETLKKHQHLKLIGHSQPFWIEISGDAPTDREGRNSRGEGPVAPGGRVMELLRKYPNLYADLSAGSGFCAIVRDEAFGLKFLDEFQDQLLFGTDTVDVNSPWQPPLADWLEEKYAMGLISEPVMRKICYENAERLFGKLLHDDENTDVTETPCGLVKGLKDEKRRAYMGIPYASAERFAYPTVTTHWEGTLDATDFGPCSWQFRAFRSEALGEDPFYYHEFRKDIPFRYGDDCQRLNIWTPLQKPDKPLPVIVYIHGGAFLGGSSGEKHLAPPCWTEEGVIAVSLNYRLGPFGFLCASAGVQERGHTGNYGIYDQLAALQWVRDNISAFGGDPDNVTLTLGQVLDALHADELVAKIEDQRLNQPVTLGQAADFLKNNEALQAQRDREFTFKTSIGDLFDLFGEENVKQLIQEKTASASHIADYERTVENVVDNWLMLGLFTLAFAGLAMISLELIDKDKR